MHIAIYVRVSTQRQASTQTIEQQLDLVQDYCRAHGWSWRDEHIFRDDGYSGASLRRPGLDQLRDFVRNAAFDRVILSAPDRLARNYVHQMLLIEELEQGGCQVEFVDHPMSRDPHDQLLLQIRGAVAEYERSLIAERMRRGRLHKYQAGCLLPWTSPPYGYRVDPARPRDPAGVRIQEDEAAVIVEMVNWYLYEERSLLSVTKQLMARHIPTPRGGWRWNQSSVRGILSNPSYTGTIFIGRSHTTVASHRHSPLAPIGKGHGGHPLTKPEEWTAVAHIPAIISQEHFDQIQARLASNQRYARRHNTTHFYLLRALVSCGQCRLACTGRSSQTGYAYYTCRGKSHPIASCRDEKCPSRHIPADQLDVLVWQDVCDVLMHPEMITVALQHAQGGQWLPQELRARREHLRKARVSLEHQMERLTDAYVANVLQLPEYKRRHQELEQRLLGISEQGRQLEASVGRHDELAGMVQSIEAFCQRVQHGLANATHEQKRQLIELLIDRVVVTDEQVEIRYVIPTSPHSELVPFCHLRLDYFDIPASGVELGHILHRERAGIKHIGQIHILLVAHTIDDQANCMSGSVCLIFAQPDDAIERTLSIIVGEHLFDGVGHTFFES
jgi:site-specific DNA recombinase